jgi:hypothetical protein
MPVLTLHQVFYQGHKNVQISRSHHPIRGATRVTKQVPNRRLTILEWPMNLTYSDAICRGHVKWCIRMFVCVARSWRNYAAEFRRHHTKCIRSSDQVPWICSPLFYLFCDLGVTKRSQRMAPLYTHTYRGVVQSAALRETLKYEACLHYH